jgi:hypothetical protein
MRKNTVVRHLTAENARKIYPIEDNFDEIVSDCLNDIYKNIELVASWGWVESFFHAGNYAHEVVLEIERILIENGYSIRRLEYEDNSPGRIRALVIRWGIT